MVLGVQVVFSLATGFCIFVWREIRKAQPQSEAKRGMLIASASIFSAGILLAWVLLGLETIPLRAVIGFPTAEVTIHRACLAGLGLLLASFSVAHFSVSGRTRWLCIWGSVLALPNFVILFFASGFALAEFMN